MRPEALLHGPLGRLACQRPFRRIARTVLTDCAAPDLKLVGV